MKTEVNLIITTTVTVNGGLPDSATVVEHVAKAQDTVASWQWSVGKGSAKNEVVPVDVKIASVTLVPDKP